MQITSHVYFVQQERDGPIKIGLAKNVVHRLDHLRAANPSELHVLAIVPGEAALEGELHTRFAKHHIRGEWFRPDQSILDYIASLPKAALRDLRLRRKYNKGRLPLDEAKKIWADPTISSRHARALLRGWTTRRIADELGHRPVNRQGENSAANGAYGGRPAYNPTMAELKDAKAIWRDDIEYPEWDDCDAALREKVNPKFTAWRAYDLWGPRTGKRR